MGGDYQQDRGPNASFASAGTLQKPQLARVWIRKLHSRVTPNKNRALGAPPNKGLEGSDEVREVQTKPGNYRPYLAKNIHSIGSNRR